MDDATTAIVAPMLGDEARFWQRPAWQADAACAEHPLELFFPERGVGAEHFKAICSGCVVRAECLAFVLEQSDPPVGIWGWHFGTRTSRTPTRG